jgi:predicted phage-related endonuclease
VILAEVGGNQFPAFWYDLDERFRDKNREKIAEFWANVRAEKIPPVDGTDSTAEALRELYPWKPDETPVDMTGDNEMPELVTRFLAAKAAAKQWDSDIDDIQNRIKAKLAGAKRAEGIGWEIRVQVNKDTPARVAAPGEIINGRRGAVILRVKQDISK